MTFLEQPSRYLFFTGKGGVGKTALACATAIRLAGAGKRILLVSTDPASNLDEMLGAPLSQRPTPIPGVDGLSALPDPLLRAVTWTNASTRVRSGLASVGDYLGIVRGHLAEETDPVVFESVLLDDPQRNVVG